MDREWIERVYGTPSKGTTKTSTSTSTSATDNNEANSGASGDEAATDSTSETVRVYALPHRKGAMIAIGVVGVLVASLLIVLTVRLVKMNK